MIKSSSSSGGEKSLSRRGEGNIRTLGKNIKSEKREIRKKYQVGKRGRGPENLGKKIKILKNGGGEEYVLIIHPLIFFY